MKSIKRKRTKLKPGRRMLHDGFASKQRHLKTKHEIIETSDSVAVLVYLEKTGEVVLAKQRRPAMEGKTGKRGYVVEVPAGRFDVKLGVKGLVAKELKEEIGAIVPKKQVKILNGGKPLALSPGVITEMMYLTFVAVRPDQIEKKDRVFGNPGEGERIKRVRMPSKKFIKTNWRDMKTWALAQYLKDYLAGIRK